jgi:hypothetical protein
MKLTTPALWLGMAAAAAACTAESTSEISSEAPVTDLDDSAAIPRGLYFVTGNHEEQSTTEDDWLAAPMHRTLFLNKSGGNYIPGSDNSSTNRSSIPSSPSTVPAYEGTAQQWATLLACVKDQFSRFDITVTDVDPGSAPHIEAVMGGNPQDIGMGSGVGGVAPMYGDCSVVERAVVYIFTKVFSSTQSECEVAAQEIGHALGMDHEYLCKDPMTYLGGCGAKTFQDVDAQCGEYEPRECMCGGSTQNSVEHLYATLGPASGEPPPPPPPPPPGDTTPPTVAITSPADGANLPANSQITVTATASDNVGVTSVDLLWTQPSGQVTVNCQSPPSGVTCSFSGGTATWKFNVGTGSRSLAVRAKDAAGNTATTPTRSITLGGTTPPPPPPNTSPTASLDAPAANAVVHPGQTIQIRATATDDEQVSQVRLAWTAPSGTSYYNLSNLRGNSWGIDLNLSSTAVTGSRSLVITATDNDGNATSTQARTIQVQP